MNTPQVEPHLLEVVAERKGEDALACAASRPKLNALTTIRFFAAMQVVLFHVRVVGILSGGPWWYQNFASIGYIGVNLFFVLSGFILVYTYAGSAKLNAWRFWQARFARIYPAYVLSLIVAAPFFFFAVKNLNLPFYEWSKQHLITACVLTVALLQSWVPNGALTWNSVCWSLSVEAFFYLLFPLLLLWSADLRRKSLFVLLAATSVFSLGVSISYFVLRPDGVIDPASTTLLWKNILSFNPVARLPEFLVGVLAGRLFLANGIKRSLATALVLGGALVLTTITLLVGKVPGPMMSSGILSPAFAAIIYGLALRPRWTGFLEARWLVLLGDASYSLYLLHSLILTRVFDRLPSFARPIRVSAAIAAAIGASLVSYLIVEEPARRLLRPRRR